MNYQAFVADLIAKGMIKETPKVAMDLAKILDNDTIRKHGYRPDFARQIVFGRLCNFLIKQGAPSPHEEEATLFIDQKFENCDIRIKISELEEQGVTEQVIEETIRAMSELVPVTPPDYTRYNAPNARQEKAPVRKARVTIVDDSVQAIIESALALVGWPEVEIDLFLLENDVDHDLLTTARAVVNRQPQIILMDRKLGGRFDGMMLVAAIKAIDDSIVTVANTSDQYAPPELGTYDNFQKGQKWEGIRQAMAAL